MRKRKAEKAWLGAVSGGCQNILKPTYTLGGPTPHHQHTANEEEKRWEGIAQEGKHAKKRERK